jgi:hypothetical protein
MRDTVDECTNRTTHRWKYFGWCTYGPLWLEMLTRALSAALTLKAMVGQQSEGRDPFGVEGVTLMVTSWAIRG